MVGGNDKKYSYYQNDPPRSPQSTPGFYSISSSLSGAMAMATASALTLMKVPGKNSVAVLIQIGF